MIPSVGVSAASADDQGSVRAIYLWLTAASGALGGLLFGYDWVVIGGAKPFYERFFHLDSPSLEGWAMSCALIGCLFGAISSGPLSNRFGRRRLLTLAAITFAVSSLGTGLAFRFGSFRRVENHGRLCHWTCLWRVAHVHRRNLAGKDARPAGFTQPGSHRFRNSACAGGELAHRAAGSAGRIGERNTVFLERAGRMAMDVRGHRDSVACSS